MPNLLRTSDNDEIADTDIPRVPWETAADEFIDRWQQGQHLAVLGKTNSGKTTFVMDALKRAIEERDAHVIALAVKARDQTLRKTHWPIVREWPPTYEQRQKRGIIFWPPYSKTSRARLTTRPKVEELLDGVMAEGGWRLFVDEMAYLVETLGLRRQLDEYWNGARSSGISLIAASQRPTWVARSGVSQMDWVACFRINDTDDRQRAGEILGDRRRYAEAIKALRAAEHEFLLVNVNTDQAVITHLDAPPRFD